MATLMDASNQWATRPQDERFLSLDDMLADATQSRNNAQELVVKLDDIKLIAPKGGNQLLLTSTKKGAEPFGDLTNWSFQQVAALGDAQPGSMIKRPADMVADWINYGLKQRAAGVRSRYEDKRKNAEDGADIGEIKDAVKILVRDHHLEDGTTRELAAVTGQGYGRIWDIDVIKRLRRMVGDGVTGQWKVPGEFGRNVQVTTSNTTLYRSDRDMFVFLANEEDKIEVGGRLMSRGFFLWQSETGGATIGYKRFLFDYVCCNRIVWGASQVKGKVMRHTQSAPTRMLEEFFPQIYMIMDDENTGYEEKVLNAARGMELGKGGLLEYKPFITANFGPTFVNKFADVMAIKEGETINTLFDVVTAATWYSQTIPHADRRTDFEEKASNLLNLAARNVDMDNSKALHVVKAVEDQEDGDSSPRAAKVPAKRGRKPKAAPSIAADVEDAELV